LLVTSLDREEFPADTVLKLYRMRWRIELAFKRLKSLTGLRSPPAKDPRIARPWILAHFLIALVTEPSRRSWVSLPLERRAPAAVARNPPDRRLSDRDHLYSTFLGGPAPKSPCLAISLARTTTKAQVSVHAKAILAPMPKHRRRNPFHPRLDLQRHIFRVKPRQRQIAAVEPQRVLRRRLPHVAQLALPRTGIALDAGAEAPAWPDLVGDLARDDGRHGLVHRLVAGTGDDRIDGQLAAVVEQDAGRRQ
ncbi:transposase, partial [Mesorhizobium sp. M0659]|uniref:transposase n=1 Tax=Mesorhizobium sp. M0659 TaxID=2956980 RepID=UPI0033357548